MLLLAIRSENNMNKSLKEIFEKFQVDGPFGSAAPFGSGHIHDTYLATTTDKSKDQYILQRLNNRVFKNIPQLQNNIERVTSHIRSKLIRIPGSDIKRECLNLVYSRDGKSWILDREQNYWRMYIFITNHKSFNIVDSPDKAFEVSGNAC
jgi:hypothetical protein